MTKGLVETNLLTLICIGRRGGIRTRDPLHPMQVRYQAALHAEDLIITRSGGQLCCTCSSLFRSTTGEFL